MNRKQLPLCKQQGVFSTPSYFVLLNTRFSTSFTNPSEFQFYRKDSVHFFSRKSTKLLSIPSPLKKSAAHMDLITDIKIQGEIL